MRFVEGDRLDDADELIHSHRWVENKPVISGVQLSELLVVLRPWYEQELAPPKARVRQRSRPKIDRGSEGRTRDLVRARSGGWCERCGERRAETMHHRRFRSQGGPWTPSNILHLCGDGTRLCHGELTAPGFAQRGKYEAAGWIVSSHQDWREVPVLRRGELVVLDDLGGWSVVEGDAA